MLAFIDESGHPHANDSSTRPVVVAVCFDEQDSRFISGRIHAMKRDILGKENAELKGRTLINRPTFRRQPQAVAFAEELFDALRNFPITIFAMIMEAPFMVSEQDPRYLENRFRFLLQRIESLAEEQRSFANIHFDGQPNLYGGLSGRFSSYLFRSSEGQSSALITDTPAFVDSASSIGIQIADMCAYVVRIYQENRLFAESPPPGDQYLYAIRRWYGAIQNRTREFRSPTGEPRPGLYLMGQGDM